jgi:hypothetical protein
MFYTSDKITRALTHKKFLEQIQNDGVKDANVVASIMNTAPVLLLNTYWIDTIAGGTSGNYQFQTRSPMELVFYKDRK